MNAPYYIIPAVEALPDASGEERKRLVRLIAANIGDEATLRTVIGIDPSEFTDFYPDMRPPELTTEATIDSFISRFAPEGAEQTPEIEKIVAAPSIDYATVMAGDDVDDVSDSAEKEGYREADATDNAINAFLNAVPPKTPSARRMPRKKNENVHNAEKQNQAPELSEALFKLMVKNKNYSKALEIIKDLSLNNPKKSIYFAYQIRFLEKLIKNQAKGAK